MVRRLFGHCDAETLIALSTSPSVTTFLPHAFAAMIRKHFPFSSPDCPLGILQRRKSLYSPPSEPSTIGVEWEVDLRGNGQAWMAVHRRPFNTSSIRSLLWILLPRLLFCHLVP